MDESNESSATLHRKEQATAAPSTPLLHSSNPTLSSLLPAQREDDSPNGHVASSLSSLRPNNNIQQQQEQQQQQQQHQEPPTKQGAAAAATAEDEKARATASSPSSAAKAVTSGSPFLTTSDIIRHLNKALAETPSAPPVVMPSEYEYDDMEDEPLEQDQVWNDDHHDTSTKARPAATAVAPSPAAHGPPPSPGTLPAPVPPQFELHRRWPDGSTRRVSPSEQEAADLESKLQQVAAHIAPLPPTQQWEWIHNQKSYGNQLFARQEYVQAMDVYLTCVMMTQNLQKSTSSIVQQPPQPQQPPEQPTAPDEQQEQDKDDEQLQQAHSTSQPNNKDSFTSTTTTTTTTIDHKEDKEEVEEERPPLPFDVTTNDFDLLFLQLMNNMAQSALHLSWYHKTIQFCNLALEEIGKQHKQQQGQPNHKCASPTAQSSKLYFKRAKAHRLRGQYTQARSDLQQAKQYLLASHNQELVKQQANDNLQPNEQQPTNASLAGAAAAAAALKEIAREEQWIERHKIQERQNYQRQQRNLQALLGGSHGHPKSNHDSSTPSVSVGSDETAPIRVGQATRVVSAAAYRPLYDLTDDDEDAKDDNDTIPRRRKQTTPRAFSSLKAPPPCCRRPYYSPAKPTTMARGATTSTTDDDEEDDPSEKDKNDDENDGGSIPYPRLTYWQWYLAVIGKIAEELLIWMGDEEFIERRRRQQQQQQLRHYEGEYGDDRNRYNHQRFKQE
ncbi:hypothetical protein ACA910_021356 [Epithemia clementina (nom. ined.)]